MNKLFYIIIILTLLGINLPIKANAYNIKLKQQKKFIPILASLRTSEANLRTGPGRKYPVKWIYIKKRWPVKILAQLEHWRKIQTLDKTEGWFHKSQLSSKKTSVVMNSDYLRKKHKKTAKKLVMLEKGLVVDIIKCKIYWCKIKIKERRFSGWFIKNYLWGTNFIKIEK